MKTEKTDWSVPDENGILHVPDELAPLFNKIATQFRFHTISGKAEAIAVAHCVQHADDYASQKIAAYKEQIEIAIDERDEKIAALQAGENFKKFTLQIESPTVATDYTVYEKQEIEQKPDFDSIMYDLFRPVYQAADTSDYFRRGHHTSGKKIDRDQFYKLLNILKDNLRAYVSPLYSRIKALEQEILEMLERTDRDLEAWGKWQRRAMTAEAKIKELEASLDEIANPIKYIQLRAKEEGMQINGYMASELSRSASYLKEIAEKALRQPLPSKPSENDNNI